jgi:L-rhamnonate dehydratase
MRIAKVEALHMRKPAVEEKADGTQEVLVVRVTTDEGLTGHGEAVSNASVARAIVEAPRSDRFRHGLAAVLVGTDPLEPEARWAEMYEATRWYGRRGAVMHAISAVDTALWDLVGQARGLPCHALWGTRRDRIRAYASVLFPDEPAAAAALAADLVGRGFTAIKLGWGRFGRDRDWDLATLGAVREAIGDGIDLMVDAGRVWTADEALRRAPELFDRFGLLWLEEPLHEDDLEGYAALCASLRGRGRVAAGETEETVAHFAGLLERGVAVIQPDVGRTGGLGVCVRLSALARGRGAWCVPHSFGTGVNLAASVQWMACAEEAPMTEYPVTASPLRNELVRGIPELAGGQVVVPDRPGLGIALDPAVVERFRVRA